MLMVRKIVLLLVASLTCGLLASAQTKQVSGTVKDANGNAIVGATVIVDGTTIGTNTGKHCGFFSGAGIVEAFSGSDASVGLMFGSFFAFVIVTVFYALRRVLSFGETMVCVPEGFKAMVPAILILTFAWTLKAMTDSLGAADYVAGVVESAAGGFLHLLPAIIFLVGCLLSFATGTSWGTFGILIPIVVAVFQGTNETMMIISISACMAGAVCGDHCSPISDTTIMSSAGAQCNHVNHVTTQLPYAVTCAAVSFVTYIIAGFVQNPFICLPVGILLMIGTLAVIRKINA